MILFTTSNDQHYQNNYHKPPQWGEQASHFNLEHGCHFFRSLLSFFPLVKDICCLSDLSISFG